MPASRNKSVRFQPAHHTAKSGSNPPNNPGNQERPEMAGNGREIEISSLTHRQQMGCTFRKSSPSAKVESLEMVLEPVYDR